MLVGIIARYLESHRRLIIPQMGAFIVKEPGRGVLFSELLKRDDGVLRGLLVEAGVGEIEAAGRIDRFVFEVRHAVQEGREYPLSGLGVMKPGPNGTISFAYDPQAVAPTAPEAAAGRVPLDSAAAPILEIRAQEPAADAPRSAEVAAEVGFEEPATGNAPANRQMDKFSEAVRTLYGEPASPASPASPAFPAATSAKPAAPAMPATSAEPAAENSGTPVSGEPERPAALVQSGASRPEAAPKFATEVDSRPQFSQPKRSKRDDFSDSYYGRLPRRPAIEQTVRVKKRSDHFIWIALIATLIALAAIAFGQWIDSQTSGF
ncbi:MAG: hypothetical protein NC209_02935 [Alistipes sp.]|nr:hypothetical protein [Alistipes senegalensis]MCM1250084.1 hypothetical protein [Alistipes sp.]